MARTTETRDSAGDVGVGARKQRKRAHGEGSIWQRPAGGWAGALTLPNGKRKTLYAARQDQLLDKMNAARREHEGGRDLTARRTKVGEFLDRGLVEVAALAVGVKTLSGYRCAVESHLKPDLGGTWLHALTAEQVQRMVNAKRAAGLKPNTLMRIRDVLRNALGHAVDLGLVAKNPAERVALPPIVRGPIEPLTVRDARTLTETSRETRYGPLLALAVFTGMRQGELLGLRWSDVDEEAAVLHVRQTRKAVGGEATFGLPKTKTSARTVALPAVAVAAIKRQETRQKADRIASGGSWANPHDLVFTRPSGQPMSGDEVRDALDRALSEAGLKRVTFHTVRHSFVAMMSSMEVRIEVVSDMLGHSDIRVTLNVYGHLYPDVKRDAAQMMDTIFSTG